MKFRKKPVVIEAVQFTDNTFEECIRFLGSSARLDIHKRAIIIPTLEGDMNASFGDWIIKGVEGEFYPSKPEIFAKCYDAIPDNPEYATASHEDDGRGNIVERDPIRVLIATHQNLLDAGNSYAYFELAYTRQTGWSAWLCDRPPEGTPGTPGFGSNRTVLAKGQGQTATLACEAALVHLKKSRE